MQFEIKNLNKETAEYLLWTFVVLLIVVVIVVGIIKIKSYSDEENKKECISLGKNLNIKTSPLNGNCYAISNNKMFLISYYKISEKGLTLE